MDGNDTGRGGEPFLFFGRGFEGLFLVSWVILSGLRHFFLLYILPWMSFTCIFAIFYFLFIFTPCTCVCVCVHVYIFE